MALPILGGLMAGANFGTGFLQGQQQSQQNQVMNEMNQLALGEQKLKYQQDQLAATNQQALSDDAMKAFSATSGITLPGQQPNPMAPPGKPGIAGATDPTMANLDPAGKMDYLANKAAARGDLVSANELWTNATNSRAAMSTAQQHQDAIKTAELNRQIKSHAFVAQLLGSATDEEDFNQKKFQALGSGLMSPEEAKNIVALKYSPQAVESIRTAGMNSAQQAQAQLRQQQEVEKQRNEAMNQERKDRDEARKDLHESAWQKHLDQQKKTGAIIKAPTKADINTAAPIIADVIGIDKDDALLSDIDPSDPKKFTQATPAVLDVVGRAQQIVNSNKAISYPQAVRQAAQEAKDNGEFGTKTEKGGLFSKDKTVGTFSVKGTQASPLPLPKNIKDLIPGKYYVGPGGKVEQWTGQ